jgi:MFS transporter, CP family, cyanate transporter
LTLSRTHWPGVLAVVAAGLAIALNVGKVPVALPALRSELGLSLVQAGWVSSMLTTVAVFSAAIVGMWVGRIGALRMVLGGLLVCAAASLLPVLAPAGWAVLIGSRFLEGFGFMIVAVTCPALITAASGPTSGASRSACGAATCRPAPASRWPVRPFCCR